MAKSASAFNAGLANPHDQKTEIRRLSIVFSQEKSKTGKRRNLGTFKTKAAANKHERAVQYFKRR
jgi:hypothetical protein